MNEKERENEVNLHSTNEHDANLYSTYKIYVYHYRKLILYLFSVVFCVFRSNDENADAYKIFSILYGLGKYIGFNCLDIFYFSLVIFIGGVAFSISHAIIPTEEAENIKHIVEVNNCFQKSKFSNNFD